MVMCLILSHQDITTMTISKMLRAIFHQKQYEIYTGKNQTTMLVWGISKMELWQAAAQFEFAGIAAGYGFAQAERKSDAKHMAEGVLQVRQQK